MGQIQKAMDVYEKAMEIAPDNDEAKQGMFSIFSIEILVDLLIVSLE